MMMRSCRLPTLRYLFFFFFSTPCLPRLFVFVWRRSNLTASVHCGGVVFLYALCVVSYRMSLSVDVHLSLVFLSHLVSRLAPRGLMGYFFFCLSPPFQNSGSAASERIYLNKCFDVSFQCPVIHTTLRAARVVLVYAKACVKRAGETSSHGGWSEMTFILVAFASSTASGYRRLPRWPSLGRFLFRRPFVVTDSVSWPAAVFVCFASAGRCLPPAAIRSALEQPSGGQWRQTKNVARPLKDNCIA